MVLRLVEWMRVQQLLLLLGSLLLFWLLIVGSCGCSPQLDRMLVDDVVELRHLFDRSLRAFPSIFDVRLLLSRETAAVDHNECNNDDDAE